MPFNLFRRKNHDDVVAKLYGAIVAQAREPAFYVNHGVPDTVSGRFEMMALHVFLLLHRLKEETAERRELGQSVFDLFFLDLDRGLRELGVGDTSVPKKIKAMASSFYGRVLAYEKGLGSAEPQELAEALARNALGRTDLDATGLAAYTRTAVASLGAQPFEHFVEGHIDFPKVMT